MKTALIRNSAFTLGAQAVTVLAAFVSIPIAFRQLGTDRFGLLTLVWTLLSSAVLFDLGTAPAVARGTAASIVTDQGRRIRAILRAGIVMQLALGAFTALVIALFAAPLLALLNVPHAYRADGVLALYALALCMPTVMIAQSQQAVLQGLERFDLIAYIRTPVAVATYAIPAAGALAGWSIARMMFVILATRVAAVLITYAFYRATLPAQQEGASREELPGLFRYGRWIAISSALTSVLLYLDRFVLSGLHGLNAVAQYAAPYDAASKLMILPGSVGVAMFPSLSKDAARQQSGEAAARARAAGRTTMLLLIPIGALLVIIAAPLLRAWLGPQLQPEGIAAFRILVVATIFLAAATPYLVLIDAVGRSNIVAQYLMCELIGYVPVLVLAVWRFGVPGAAWAWVARNVALLLWSAWYVRRKIGNESSIATGQYAHAD
jgi:O-antigen/teichoic acid export membrane protein